MATTQEKFLKDVAFLKKKELILKDAEIVANTGASKGNVSDYLSGRANPSKPFLEKFYAYYEKFLIQNKSVQKKEPGYNLVNEPYVQYKTRYKDAVILDLGDSLVMHVPLVNKYAYAGYLSGYGDAEYVESLPRVPFAVDKEYKGTYIAFEVKGESMNNGTRAGYIEGDILLCREVPQHHWQSKLHIKKWDFVIVTKTDGILIKQISKHNTATGDLTLHSLNEDYDDIQMNLNQVAKIFNVVQVSYKK